jgi:hypothetical protein|tara:strand:+ start:841 stop:1158 length:318 start_codon:yes stop_codon:yes gene_type:complete
MSEDKSYSQRFLEDRAGRIEDLERLQNLKEFESLKWYFQMVAENSVRELVAVKDLSVAQQERLKAKIEICKYEFENIGIWLKNEDEAARELFQELHDTGEIKDLT